MKYLLILIIVVIEFNLQWINNENTPNIVTAWDENGEKVELIEERINVDGVWIWDVRTSGGEYNWQFISW